MEVRQLRCMRLSYHEAYQRSVNTHLHRNELPSAASRLALGAGVSLNVDLVWPHSRPNDAHPHSSSSRARGSYSLVHMHCAKLHCLSSGTSDALLDTAVDTLEACKGPITDAVSVPGLGVALDLIIGVLKKIQVRQGLGYSGLLRT